MAEQSPLSHLRIVEDPGVIQATCEARSAPESPQRRRFRIYEEDNTSKQRITIYEGLTRYTDDRLRKSVPTDFGLVWSETGDPTRSLHVEEADSSWTDLGVNFVPETSVAVS